MLQVCTLFCGYHKGGGWDSCQRGGKAGQARNRYSVPGKGGVSFPHRVQTGSGTQESFPRRWSGLTAKLPFMSTKRWHYDCAQLYSTSQYVLSLCFSSPPPPSQFNKRIFNLPRWILSRGTTTVGSGEPLGMQTMVEHRNKEPVYLFIDGIQLWYISNTEEAKLGTKPAIFWLSLLTLQTPEVTRL